MSNIKLIIKFLTTHKIGNLNVTSPKSLVLDALKVKTINKIKDYILIVVNVVITVYITLNFI